MNCRLCGQTIDTSGPYCLLNGKPYHGPCWMKVRQNRKMDDYAT